MTKENDDLIESYGIARASRTFVGSDNNMSVRSEYNRSDYEYFREGEKIPKTQKEIMQLCMRAYDRVFIIKNVVDLMADFVCQGITIFHPIKSCERFMREWWVKSEGNSVSERFANTIYRAGNVVIEKHFANIPVGIEKKWKKAKLEKIVEPKVEKRKIPLSYSFVNPLCLDVLGDAGSTLLKKPQYIIRMAPVFSGTLTDMARIAPTAFKQNINVYGYDKTKTYVELDPDKFSVYHYKKDDWMLWGVPFSSAVLDQLRLLDKMHLADVSALDGVISNIRLWRLGIYSDKGPDSCIMPQAAGIQKLRNVLANNVGGGVLDLVWGPELDFKESNTQVHNFLGPDKYKQVMSEIYEGLGIPPTLTAGADKSGYSNNYISMKTLIERLRYVRNLIQKFWQEEFVSIQKALGWNKPAQLSFDYDILEDPSLVKKFWTDLWDRNIMSTETLRAKVNISNIVEDIRIHREEKQRKTNKKPKKASPFHDPDMMDQFRKILLQGGSITASEAGLELLPRTPGETPAIDKKVQQKEYSPKKDNGRPKNSKDSGPRKPKVVKVKTKGINMMMWANKAQKEVNNILSSVYLAKANKDYKSLSLKEKKELEAINFDVFSNLKPYSDIVPENLVYSTNEELKSIANSLVEQFIEINGKKPNIKDRQLIYSSAYILQHGDNDGDSTNNG